MMPAERVAMRQVREIIRPASASAFPDADPCDQD